MTYKEALTLTLKKYNQKPVEDEWLWSNFREKHVNSMSSEEAFNAIETTLDMLLTESDESNSNEIVQTIIDLARVSNTTEVPQKLIESKLDLMTSFKSFGPYANNKLAELFLFYRIAK